MAEAESTKNAAESTKNAIEQLKNRIKYLEKENRKWMRLAGVNHLTELPNSLLLFQVGLPRELRKGLDKPISLSCILVCPDGLGGINQMHGRTLGDGLIKEISAFMKTQVDSGEQLYHCDGSNFAILMPGTTEGVARRKATGLKDQFKEEKFSVGTRQFDHLTCSVGVADIGGPIERSRIAEYTEQLYHQLCNSLYKAKEHGGDSVISSPKI